MKLFYAHYISLENAFVRYVAVGHNPSVAYVLHLFCKEIHHFAPGSFAVLNFENPHHPQLTYFGE